MRWTPPIPKSLYAGTMGGGVFKTTNSGADSAALTLTKSGSGTGIITSPLRH